MQVAQTIAQVRRARGGWGPVGLVPTMGALHEGHVSLVRRAREICERVAVSIFVNPTQFGPDEDLTRYPRPLEKDLEMCREAGVDLVFVPSVQEIYPVGEIETIIDVPSLTGMLEGAHRPGHFVGVCRVVTKLLNIVRPDVACFGMKDYQQLRVVEAMVEAMAMPVRIERCPTLREPDGLAMSSRNIYLDEHQRKLALGLSKALGEAQQLIKAGEVSPACVESAMRQIITSHRFELDYATVRDAKTLQPIDLINPKLEPVVCLAAGNLGGVRLIDNVLID